MQAPPESGSDAEPLPFWGEHLARGQEQTHCRDDRVHDDRGHEARRMEARKKGSSGEVAQAQAQASQGLGEVSDLVC
ncbi:unnamed protein product [Prorocentrum cordatum]|uniref:Uncharacterized protein n=1 Tax=Prorocentrum cordatum TaxID=2364126 RepID=A0ABN9TWP5_9DINO|nr:unnamed protein product [Polarella glacialis]